MNTMRKMVGRLKLTVNEKKTPLCSVLEWDRPPLPGSQAAGTATIAPWVDGSSQTSACDGRGNTLASSTPRGGNFAAAPAPDRLARPSGHVAYRSSDLIACF